MRFVVQRVSRAQVSVDGKITGEIGKGFLVLMGTEEADDEKITEKMVKKLLGLRIFEDENGKTNLSLSDVKGELLMVSQFTLYADCRKGNRPSFIRAGDPEKAESLYQYAVKLAGEGGIRTGTGIFGADMKVELLNDGPFTILLDSRELGYQGNS